MQATLILDSPDGVESGLLDAFWIYERALLDNDVAMLDQLFLAGPSTLRADASGVLVGHEQIAAFRASRPGGAPARTITALHVRNLGEQTRLILAETLRPNGSRGLQTQVWQYTSDGWRVSAAHVSASPPSDPHIWRAVGAPLLAATGAGPLSGLRVAVKDLFDLAGQRVGGGTPEYLAAAPVCDTTASAVQILLDNGADVAGLAHTDELAYSIAGVNPHYGAPANPAAPGRIPGGSSSGPACAVSRGEADIGLGTDTAGSVRVPASYQGLWGLRTTHGVVPTDGMLHLAPSFDAVGWLTRDLETLRAVASVALADSPPSGSTINVVVDPTLVSYADFATAQTLWATIRILKDVVPISYVDVVDDHVDDWFMAFRTVQGFEAWRTHGEFLTAHPGAVRVGWQRGSPRRRKSPLAMPRWLGPRCAAPQRISMSA